MDTDMGNDISEQIFLVKIFNSKFRARCEHDLSRKCSLFLEPSASAGTVEIPLQIIQSCGITSLKNVAESKITMCSLRARNFELKIFAQKICSEMPFPMHVSILLSPEQFHENIYLEKPPKIIVFFHAQNIKSIGFPWISLSELT